MVGLGEVLRPSSDPVTVNASASYPNLGLLSFGRGTFEKPDIEGLKTSANTLYRVHADQFIYSRLFAFEGAFAIVPAELDGRFVSNEFPTFDINHSKTLPGYLAWVFRQPALWQAAAGLGVGMGDRRRRVHPDALLTLCIPLPPLAEQKYIVARLNGVAERITKRTEAVKKVEAELGAMLQAAFRRMTGEAPLVRLGDVAPLVRRTVSVDPDLRYEELGIRSFGRGTFHKPAVLGAEIASKAVFAIEPGDLLFNIIFAWEGAIAVAQPKDIGRIGSHRFLTCVPTPALATAPFLRFALLTPEGMTQIQRASPGGAGRNRTLSLGGCADLRVPLPSLDTQQDFDKLHAQVEAALAAQRTAAAELDKLLPALLHEAFGEGLAVLPRAAA